MLKLRRWQPLVFILFAQYATVCSQRVAVIGAGIGGTASAYFLRQLLKPAPDIDIFEVNEVGGRLATVQLGGRTYESGGSIIHPRNRHVHQLVNALGLKKRKQAPEGLNAFYDGKEVVFEETGWAWWDMARAAYRYGPLTFYNANKQLQSMLADFERIYDAQDKGQSFANVSDLLSLMSPNFEHLASSSAAKIEGVSSTFIQEIVGAAVRVNYAQWPSEVTQFVAFVSLAAIEGGLWAIDGGNRRLPEALLEASQAQLRKQLVRAVIQNPGGGFNLSLADGTSKAYDAVVVATPLTEGGLEMPVPVKRRPMEGVWVTLVESDGPRADYFGGRSLEDILSVGPTWFNSLARVQPVDEPIPAPAGKKHVYKIFSSEKPTKEKVESVLSGVEALVQVHFFAYPHYEWQKGPDGPLLIAPGLVHVNAIEWAASAMEMSAIAAKNSALLIADHFKNAQKIFRGTVRDEL